ncbi:hypothetical protein [Streptomyces antimycoticus]
MDEGEHRAADDEQFEERHGAVLKTERVAEVHDRFCVMTGIAEFFSEALSR